MEYCFFKDRVVPREEAKVSMASHSLQYGSSCFAGIRGYVRAGKVRFFRLKEHHERLMNGSKILGFGFYIPFEDFRQALIDLVEANHPKSDFYIRAFLFTENEQVGVCYDKVEFNLGIYFTPLGNYYASDKGLRMTVSSWQKISDSSISTKAKAGGAYVNSAMARTEAMRSGYDEALMMDHNQNIVEASVANLFVVYRQEIFTPSVGSDVLEGVTWRTMIELLKEMGYAIRYEPISRSMVYTCDELFLTGTAAQIISAESVDGRPIGRDGKDRTVATKLKQRFADLIDMKHPKSKEYITEVALPSVGSSEKIPEMAGR